MWLVLIGAQVEGTAIPEVVPVEGVVPKAKMTAGAASEPAKTAAPGEIEGVHDEALPETSMQVVVRSPEVQDAEPICSAPMSEAAATSCGRLELLADDLIDPATMARNLESMRRVEQLAHECCTHLKLRIASDCDLVNCYKSLQKLACQLL
jgi:hypothetical protein